jgi:hypothetical protein
VLLGAHAALGGSQRNLLAVLVRAGDEGDGAALQALKPRDRIGGYGRVRAAHVGRCMWQLQKQYASGSAQGPGWTRQAESSTWKRCRHPPALT